MTFYQLLFSRKLNGINRNLTWYWNLFAKYLRENVGTLLAKILKIKGNTIVWNQLIEHGNMDSGWFASNSTINSYSSGVLTFTATAQNGLVRPTNTQNIYKDHKYFGTMDVKSTTQYTAPINFTSRNKILSADYKTTWTTYNLVFTNTVTEENYYPRAYDNRASGWDAVQIRNCMLIDLTAMGLDWITTPSEFTSLFPLSYYAYDSGSLLSFNGSGIKTTGFNQWDEEWEVGNINQTTGQNEVVNSCIRSKNYMPLLPNTTYYFYGAVGNSGNVKSRYYDANFNYIGSSPVFTPYNTFTPPTNARYYRFALQENYGTKYKNDVCINVSDANKNGTYEPYEEHTLSLPISSYFPTGLKSAGSIYDQLDETGYITRVGEVDLGSLSWTYDSSVPRFYSTDISAIVKKVAHSYDVANIICPKYSTTNIDNIYQASVNNAIAVSTGGAVSVKDASYTDANTFKSAMSDVYLYYELATPLENYGVVDLGSLTWTYQSGGQGRFESNGIASVVKKPSANSSVANVLSAKYQTANCDSIYVGTTAIGIHTGGDIWVHDANGGTDPSAFKTAMSGVYLLYELIEPAVIDLDLSYEIEWGGTEQLLPENTSTPTTSPISATVEYPDGEHEDYYTYQEIEKNHLRLNRALSIMLGRNVLIENPQEPLNIIMRGE